MFLLSSTSGPNYIPQHGAATGAQHVGSGAQHVGGAGQQACLLRFLKHRFNILRSLPHFGLAQGSQQGAGSQQTGAGAQQVGAGAQHTGSGAQQTGSGAQQVGAGAQQLGSGQHGSQHELFFLKQSNKPASADCGARTPVRTVTANSERTLLMEHFSENLTLRRGHVCA